MYSKRIVIKYQNIHYEETNVPLNLDICIFTIIYAILVAEYTEFLTLKTNGIHSNVNPEN